MRQLSKSAASQDRVSLTLRVVTATVKTKVSLGSRLREVTFREGFNDFLDMPKINGAA